MEMAQSTTTAGTHSKCTVLVVDDDVELCKLIAEYLDRQGYTVQAAHDGRNGLARALNEHFDFLILDGMLPVLDGLEVLRQLRKRSSIPVIMLTARTQERDRISGLDTGADDYLPKPFSPDELLARIRAVLRRYKGGSHAPVEVLRAGPLELNPAMRTVLRSGELISVTETEFKILELLVRSAGRIVTRDEIAAVLYQRKSTPYERSLDVHMSHLRKKVEMNGPILIYTVRNVGYTIAPQER
jgi:two-component system response regulator CpxR